MKKEFKESLLEKKHVKGTIQSEKISPYYIYT